MEEINFTIASNKKRMASFFIDDVIVALLLFTIFYTPLMQMVSSLPPAMTLEDIEKFKDDINHFASVNLLFILLLKVLYHTFFIWQNGTTLGKYMMKIRVVEMQTASTPRLHKALLRAVIRIASEVFFYLGFLLAFFIPLNQTLHDKLSHCVVVDA